jgi:hypothetical protein
MRPVRHENRASLPSRTADELPLLRRTVLCGIPKDDGASSREESAMKCSNPNCGHGIGLVSYQRHWFDKRRFCSKRCRDDFTVERPRPSQQERLVGSYFNWLFANKLLRVTIRGNWRKRALQHMGGRPRSSATPMQVCWLTSFVRESF